MCFVFQSQFKRQVLNKVKTLDIFSSTIFIQIRFVCVEIADSLYTKCYMYYIFVLCMNSRMSHRR